MNSTRNTFLASVAVIALMAGSGLAYAQSPAPAAPQSAPAEKTSPVQAPDRAATSKTPDTAVKPGQAGADLKMDRKSTRAQSAHDNAKDGMMPKGGAMSKGSNSGANAESNSQDRSRAGARQDKSRSDESAESRTNSDTRSSEQTRNRSDDATFGNRDRASADRSESLSGDQRSTIRTVITRQNVQPMRDVNFAISVGTRVPRGTHFNRVPRELVAIYPRWRGYDYVLVGEQILVVNPRTHQIVAILDA